MYPIFMEDFQSQEHFLSILSWKSAAKNFERFFVHQCLWRTNSIWDHITLHHKWCHYFFRCVRLIAENIKTALHQNPTSSFASSSYHKFVILSFEFWWVPISYIHFSAFLVNPFQLINLWYCTFIPVRRSI